MVSQKELKSRVKDFLRFSRQELNGLIPAILVTAFIFSFRDWGEDQFNLIIGLTNLFLMILITALTFFFRISWQKIYALSEGYQAEFKVWWAGLVIALVLTFLSFSIFSGFGLDFHIPLVLAGGIIVSLRIKQRLGEFRYGFSYENNAVIGLWGFLANMVLAILFAILNFILPNTFIFTKGLYLNLIMGFTFLIPLPQLEGLTIFFGSRILYFLALGALVLNTILLLSGTKIGLILAVVIASGVAIVQFLTMSEK